MSCCVVGAGIIGLSSALEIQRKEPRAKVVIVADKTSPETTSDIAAGWWHPSRPTDTRTDLIKLWGLKTFEKMAELYRTDPDLYGAGMISGYHLFDSAEPDPFWSDVVMNFRHPKQSELRRLGWDFASDAYFFSTYYIQCSKYLPILTAEFMANGGRFQQKKVAHLSELSMYDVIVNCSGLGSYQLVGDQLSYPIRGQVYRISAPYIKQFLLYQDSYVIPNHSSLVVGGTKQKGNWSTSLNVKDSREIWDKAVRVLPALKSAKILGEHVGLRPGRDQIRLETELFSMDGKAKPVVHNYGHAGIGVTLHYGCSLDAADKAILGLHTRAKL